MATEELRYIGAKADLGAAKVTLYFDTHTGMMAAEWDPKPPTFKRKKDERAFIAKYEVVRNRFLDGVADILGVRIMALTPGAEVEPHVSNPATRH